MILSNGLTRAMTRRSAWIFLAWAISLTRQQNLHGLRALLLLYHFSYSRDGRRTCPDPAYLATYNMQSG